MEIEKDEYEDQIRDAFDVASADDKISILEDIYEPLSDLVLDKLDQMTDEHFKSVLETLEIEIKEQEE